MKKALRIDAIYSANSSWFNAYAQVDLLIDRDDNVMNLFEMKCYKTKLLNCKVIRIQGKMCFSPGLQLMASRK
jgi:hypothetical protein